MTPAVSVTTQEQAPALLNSQNQSPLATLPTELIWKILLLVNLDGISAVSLTCKHLNAVSQDNHLWKSLFNRRFPTPLPAEEGDCLRAYQHQYFFTHGMYASRLLNGHTRAVTAFLSVDGNLISNSFDKTIKIWDLKNGTCIRTLEGHTVSGSSFLWVDGNLISGSYDNTIKIWDLKSGTCITTLEGHTAPVTVLLWVDGMLISGSWDTTIKIWDLKSGTCRRTLEGHLHTVQSLVCIDGMLISASVDAIKIWDIKSGTCTGKLPVEMQRHVPLVSANGNLISGHRKGRIKIWDLKSRTCTRILNGNNYSDVCSLFWANGNLLSASEDDTIKIWDLKSGECIRTLECDDPERVIGYQGVRDPLWADGNLISGHPKGRIYIRDFSATTSIIFAEIANLFMSGSLYHPYRAIERFSCMPKKAKDKIYIEFSQILQLPACDLEIAKELFHDERKGSCEQKAQAIKNYLNPQKK